MTTRSRARHDMDDAQKPTDEAPGGAAAPEPHPPLSGAEDNARTPTPHAPAARGSAPVSSRPVGFIRQSELVEQVKAYDPSADEALLNRAYVFAMRAHGGQTRHSGDPYFSHPLAVAAILTELRADPASVATALLHDVVEDTDHTVDDIAATFGEEIARLVDGVTKLSQFEMPEGADKQAENFRKFVVAMAEDVRVLLVKLADRLHNIRTLHHVPKPEKRRRIARETMEIYAPLAGRIGVQRIREELEDIAFAELTPGAHQTITARLAALREHSVMSVVTLANTIREALRREGVAAEIHSREKRAYSIWRKMQRKRASFDDLADIYAFRVIVDREADCYRALGVIHRAYRLIPSEFDDYISAPKSNNYRSIHTAVIGPPSEDGRRQRIEIQIRTREMHEIAERGVAAHWQYKDRADGGASFEIAGEGAFDPYETPRRLVEMFQTGEDPQEALRYAKIELFNDQIFCFTPKSRVISLPRGATALDFAYAVHTDVGDSCIGATINGVQRPLRTPLSTGDVIEVLRSEQAPVPPEWESIATTGRARASIRRRIKKMERDEHLTLGRSIAESVFEGANLDFSLRAIRSALRRLGRKSVDQVLIEIGRGELSVNALVEAIHPGASVETETIKPASLKSFKPRVAIAGLTPGVSVTMARCCTPLPGERIVGIRGREGAITVHVIHCDALAAEDPPQDRWLDLAWRAGEEQSLSAFARIIITVRNDIGVLSDVAGVLARNEVSIASIVLGNRSREFLDMTMDVEVAGAGPLEDALAGLRALENVIDAARTGGQEEDKSDDG